MAPIDESTHTPRKSQHHTVGSAKEIPDLRRAPHQQGFVIMRSQVHHTAQYFRANCLFCPTRSSTRHSHCSNAGAFWESCWIAKMTRRWGRAHLYSSHLKLFDQWQTQGARTPKMLSRVAGQHAEATGMVSPSSVTWRATHGEVGC